LPTVKWRGQIFPSLGFPSERDNGPVTVLILGWDSCILDVFKVGVLGSISQFADGVENATRYMSLKL